MGRGGWRSDKGTAFSDIINIGGEAEFNTSFGDNDFIIYTSAGGIAYMYNAGTNRHGWGGSPTTDFHFYQEDQTDFFIESGIASAILTLESSLGTFSIDKNSNGRARMKQNGNILISIDSDVTVKICNVTSDLVEVNKDFADLSWTFGKKDSGNWLEYNAELDKLLLSTILLMNVSNIAIAGAIDRTHRSINADTTSGAFTLTLSTSPYLGQRHDVTNTGTSANQVTVDAGTKNIIGPSQNGSTIAISQDDSILIEYDGTAWRIK